MPDLESLAFAVLAFALLLPVVWAWRTVWFMLRNGGVVADTKTDLPKAVIILCVRGSDPSLIRCLEGILQQDYPRYSVRVIVDCRDDPGWNAVQEILAKGNGPHVDVQVATLDKRRETCSLKVSAQLQAIAELDPTIEVVALIDADSIPAPDWLRAMAEPFADPKVGASTGIRWFAPADNQWGSLVRHLYNAGSFPQMYVFQMAWGGSMAVHARFFRGSNLLDVWSRSFCEDIGTYGVLRASGFRLAFVPAATHINGESVDLRSCYGFLMRQLLCVRLHHVHWWPILILHVANTLAMAATVGIVATGIYLQAWDWVAWAGGLFGVYLIGIVSALSVGEAVIRRIARARHSNVPPITFSWKTIPALLLTQVLALHCMVLTIFLRRIDWRGITYAIDGPEKIRLLEYRPFRSQPIDPTRSVV
jgi:glycosyltransferase involved in cell wall biosynthesis